MKRGFLNTDKARRKLAVSTDVPCDFSAHKDKGKAKAEIPPHTSKLPLLDLHCVPPPAKEKCPDRNRFIFRRWPRDPNGKFITPSDIHGKEAGNGHNLWGATLYDFYFVRRVPSNTHALSISTGSRLTNIMKAFGELDHAKDEIAWASHEADPMEIPAWDPAQAILAHEHRVHASPPISTNKSSSVATDSTNDIIAQQSSPDIPLESPFHPSHYPSPWPLVPFESQSSPFVLHKRIPIHLLPRKLQVHDPWNLLNANEVDPDTPDKGEEESWSSRPDHIRTYSLSLPPETQRIAEIALKEAAVAEDEALKIRQTVLILPQEIEGPTEQPAIRAFLPERPCRPIKVPEAHLYLSPKGRIGTGNHSIVYEAELELPRDLFCESTYCKSCLDEQIKVEVDRLKESGEWQRRMNEAAKNYEGTKGQDIASPHTPSSHQIPPRYVGFVKVRLEPAPMQTVDMVSAQATSIGEVPPPDAPPQFFARVSDSVINRYTEYEGLVIPIHPNFQWQNPSFPDTICEHQAKKKKPVPRTATFRVAAKLSLPDDPHLEREAGNYLKFPPHFFQHWTGYNVHPPLHDPTPVSALVPQFFGYYKPDTLSKSDGEDNYSSPILLIEHCGKPIRVEKLSTDDRHECAALLYRFHSAGWLHNSFAERNILMQKQHPTCSPIEDEHICDIPHRHRPYSFRMIDFGRSVECKGGPSRAQEEMTASSLFSILGF